MVQLKAVTPNKRSPAIAEVGGSAIHSTFANSKFFQKRLNRAAVKIQAICRAFLVQARIYRQRVLTPRLKDLKDCEARKLEELHRIQEQKREETENLPARVKLEFEESEEFIALLKKDIVEYGAVNAELKQEHKELKKKNKELGRVSTKHNEEYFKQEVSNNKIASENRTMEETAEKYKYALEGGSIQKEELEKSLMTEVHKKSILKRYINKMIKSVEEKAAGAGAADDSSTATSTSRRKSSRRTGKKKSGLKGNASFNWAAHQSCDWTNQPVTLKEGDEEDSDDEQQHQQEEHTNNDSLGDLGNEKSHGSSINTGSVGHMSFLMDHQVHDESSSNSNSIIGLKDNNKSHSNSSDGASFDWATQSYNWANKSIHLEKEDDNIEAPPKGRRQQRHTTAPNSKKQSTTSSSSSKQNKSKGDSALRELLQELKVIKKELKQ